jgi:Ni/Fe-hydrogenase subunit HybB-like protein
MQRINKFKLVLWIILGMAAAIGLTRFLFGLGVTTNLTDNTPWGFWIGFDVMGGVALAAGGFVIAAFHYIFGKKEFEPIVRAAILTAFLGYIAVAVGLLFDLGLPWNIWHMIIFWNPHSPLFEVGWCVMLYLTVLTLEFTPVVLEKYPRIPFLASIHRTLSKIKIPLVILGIMLSTLHQSSLGSLFLAMPYRLHPLWYSPIIPIIFFVSAICLGFLMVMVESMTTSYLYKREQELHILKNLKKYAAIMLSFYLVFRLADIIIRGAGVFLFDASWGTSLFWIEMLLSVFIPLFIFSFPIKRENVTLLYFAALSGVVGVVFNRLNVGGLTHLNNLTDTSSFYFPSLMELTVSAGVVSLAMITFFYFIENFKVWERPQKEIFEKSQVKPIFNSFNVYLGNNQLVNRTKFSFAFVMAFGLAFALISGNELGSKGVDSTPVTRARGSDTLIIDGNRDGYLVKFPHLSHQNIGVTCGYCHHLNKPDDKATGCYECHYDMYSNGDAFNHTWHSSAQGANLNCFECHNNEQSKGKEFRTNQKNSIDLCNKCHKDIIPHDSKMKNIKNYITASYTDAMHKLCIECHTSKLQGNSELALNKPNLDKCSNCHKAPDTSAPNQLFRKQNKNKWVIVPLIN